MHRLPVVLVAIFLLSASLAVAQSGAYLHYVPLALAESDLPATTPTPPPPPLEDTVIRLPFRVLNSIQPEPAYLDGSWYFNVYRVDSGELNGAWVIRWNPNEGAATSVRQVNQEAAAAVRGAEPLPGPIAASRGSLVVQEGRLLWFGYEGDSGRPGALVMKVLEP